MGCQLGREVQNMSTTMGIYAPNWCRELVTDTAERLGSVVFEARQ
jgi:hypothetical protein